MHLQAYVNGEINGVKGKGGVLQYKHGGDNFWYVDFYKKSHPCGQYVA